MPQIASNFKSNLLNEEQQERDRWTGKKPLVQSKETWAYGSSAKQVNVNRIPLINFPKKEDPVQPSWKEIVFKLNVVVAGIEARVRRLVELGEIQKARNIVSKFPGGFSRHLDKWRTLLAKPKVVKKTAGPDQDVEANHRWIHHHSNNYRGKWVALKNGKIVGNNTSSVNLRAELQQTSSLDGVLFFKVEE